MIAKAKRKRSTKRDSVERERKEARRVRTGAAGRKDGFKGGTAEGANLGVPP